jgi:hypothetical protein
MESLFLHEAIPGHHFQISIQQEMDDLPRFRRFGGFTAFSEGWGLYAESLGKELGVYTDPYQYFGSLNAELWRAIRLVVDTGIHAKGWSRQAVLDYMYANSAVKPARAVSEAERFMAISRPGARLQDRSAEDSRVARTGRTGPGRRFRCQGVSPTGADRRCVAVEPARNKSRSLGGRTGVTRVPARRSRRPGELQLPQ